MQDISKAIQKAEDVAYSKDVEVVKVLDGDMQKTAQTTGDAKNFRLMRFLKTCRGIGVVLGLGCAILFSFGNLFVKILNTNAKLHPILLSFTRQFFLLFVAAPQVAYCRASYIGQRSDWLFLAVRALCGGLSITLNFMALSYLPLADAGVIFATTPIFTTFLGWIFLKERCHFSDIPVLCLTFVGVAFIIRPPFIFNHIFPKAEVEDIPVNDRIIGCSFAIGGALVQSGLFLALRRLRGVNYATISFFYSLSTAPILFVVVMAMDIFAMPPTYEYRFLALLISITTTAAHALMTTAAKFIPAGMVSLTRSAESAFGFVWQVTFLGKEVNELSICGCLLVAFSMAFLSLRSYMIERYPSGSEPPNKYGHYRWAMLSLEWVGHGVLWFVGVIWLIVQTMKPHHLDEPHYHHLVLLGIFIGMLLDLIMVGLIKATIKRSRPSVNVDDMRAAPAVDAFSFPSGHTSRAAMVAFITCTLLYEAYSLEPIGWPFVAWLFYVCLLGSSRIMLGRHYPLDVIGGVILGLLQALFIVGYVMPHLYGGMRRRYSRGLD